MLVFDELETVRSVQLYGTDPVYVGKADRDPVRGVRRRARRPQLRLPGPQGDPQGRRRRAAVEARAARRDPRGRGRARPTPYDVPVTMKTRKGIDDDHLTYLDAGRIAQESGCAAIALHGRTVDQAYSGAGRLGRDRAAGRRTSTSRCSATATSGRPRDALRMVEQTGAAGVVVGRGCLGRPWLFRDLAAAFAR